MKKLLVTSALPYANGPIHLGHLVEYIQTDIWVRYWKLRGRDAVYMCADDTHGTPIMMRAREHKVRPEELIERMWHEHTRDFASFLVEFDSFYTTHSEENRQLASEIYQALKAKGHIAEKEIEQAYCRQCGMFLPDRYIRGECPRCATPDQYGDACEVCSATYNPRDLRNPYCAECGSEPTWERSRHLFFRLDHFSEELHRWVRDGHVQEQIANKLEEWFAVGLQDWDISRDAPYFGFEIPGEPGKYFYVWLDAPIGYMASTMSWCKAHEPDDAAATARFDHYWRTDETDVYHFIGKDIVYFHALFWPAMLMGAGFRTPTQLCVHGFLTVNGEKMSKSRGTFITAETYARHLDPQHFRYYLASKMSSRVEDIDLNFEDFTGRVNADLVGKLANIPSRVLAILHRSGGGRLGRLDDGGRALVQLVRAECDRVAELYEARELGQLTRIVADLAGEVNRYLQEREPWQLAKDGKTAEAVTVCTGALNAFRLLATLVQPVLPRLGASTARMLELPALTWAGLDELLEERPVRPYERLADRVDKAKVKLVLEESAPSLAAAEQPAPELSLDPLLGVDLRALRVTAAEPVAGSDHLVALTLDDGGGVRPVVAGIGHAAGPPLVGKDVLVLVNLEPRKLKGRESRGMLLAAKTEAGAIPVVVPAAQAGRPVD